MMKAFAVPLLFITLFFAETSHAETITIVGDSWCPYNCDLESENPGALVEIAQHAFSKHGITVDYKILPWSRAVNETREGKYTALVGASKDDAPGFVFPDIEQGLMRNGFYVKKDSSWKYTGIDALQSVSLGVIADYTYSDQLDPYIAANMANIKKVQIVSGDEALTLNIKKLLAGRIDTLIEAQAVMNYTLAQKNLAGQLKEAGFIEPTPQDNLYIAFSPNNKKSKEYATILAKELAAMRKSKQLQTILAKYNMEDWRK
ncbi:MAG: transporter substrate-binding domain-containing protein [Rickettsiales bacterium]|nr:transporter substrate-binding domain-containing protein [Rickettsiales bacterium]